MKIVGFIPSRYGSSRFPGKPLSIINGKPMVQMVYERVSKCSLIEDLYILTDDDRIKSVANNFTDNVIMTSFKHNSGTDRIAEACNLLKLNEEDLIINVQGDQPFINIKCLNELINPFYFDSKLKMATLGFLLREKDDIFDPKNVKVIFNYEGYALYFSRSVIPFFDKNDINIHAFKHLGIYAYKKYFIDIFNNLSIGKLEKIEKLEQLRVLEYGFPILVVVTKHDSPEVDYPEDIVKLEKNININHNY